MSAYDGLDRLLHRVALQFTPAAELSFRLDQRSLDRDPAEIRGERHVFVSGLARAGTTALMRRFHATGAYRSLTYRDMPFVLAPIIWRRFANGADKKIEQTERAHGDGLLVDADSPESLDEVFWRIFAGEEYIAPTHLHPHRPDDETIESFVGYVNAVLAADDRRGRRYLSKNNNNILRLGAIRRAFPDALILIPFRDPITHASSLMRQHLRFSEMQAGDGFVGSYMKWLAHHEFGLGHRPFWFDQNGAYRRSTHDPQGIDYWLETWIRVYAWLETNAPNDARFVCYEALCEQPHVWAAIAGDAGLTGSLSDGERFKLSASVPDGAPDPALAHSGAALYSRLVARADTSS